MNRNFRLSVALDIDDLLMSCTEYAIQLANEKYHFEPPLSIYEASGWGKLGTRVDVIHEFFAKPEFYETMPVLEGAKEFVDKLSKKAEIFISTAVPPEFMGIRARRIREEFPQIPADHIYMGARKDKITTDVLFDDALHNVLNSNAQYPILMRRPWNQNSTGMLAVNTYDEFLKVIDVIARSYAKQDDTPILSEPSIIVLVGPSSCGKSKLATRILKKYPEFEKPVSYTTKDPTAIEDNDWYQYVSVEKFREMVESGEMFQSTMYAGHGYGSIKSDFENILAQGKHVITTMDICGAMSLKTHFDNVTTVYISRQKKSMIETILRKNSSIEDKANRIMGLDFCAQNKDLCDYVINFNYYDEAYKKLCDILKLEQ